MTKKSQTTKQETTSEMTSSPSKDAYLWIADFGKNVRPDRRICADLFFSSPEKFAELVFLRYPEDEQLVKVKVPADFDWWDFIPDNY